MARRKQQQKSLKGKTIVINSMEGIGDQIYQRPFIKKLVEKNEVYLSTYMPDLFADIEGLHFVDPRRKNPQKKTFRTQSKAFNRAFKYEKEPAYVDQVLAPFYKGEDILKQSVCAFFFKEYGINFNQELEWSMPDFSQHLLNKIKLPKKVAIIRPAGVRKEWPVKTRNPDHNYIDWCARVLMEYGYYVISIADLQDGEEWLVGRPPPAHLHLHNGELGVYGTIELIKKANIVVGGPGFIVPTAASTHTPQFIIFGGRMGYDTPYKLYHDTMDMTKIGWAVPDNPCRCTEVEHNCDKRIKNLDTHFLDFLRRLK